MTESEAIELLEYIRETGNGEAPYVGCTQSIAIDMAINALEKQEKIKEVFTHFVFYGNKFELFNDCVSGLNEIKSILWSDGE